MSNGAREQLRGTVSRTDYWRTPTFNSSVSDCQHSADGLRETLPHPVSPTSSRDLPGRGCGHNQLHPVILRFLPCCIKELGKVSLEREGLVLVPSQCGSWKNSAPQDPLPSACPLKVCKALPCRRGEEFFTLFFPCGLLCAAVR
ncbi:hypothetical protein D623_10029996 [Myotis brandtii]|uniref:Uncharacterized protein n=1 Tax=Myotis brandtii TaxID=109478 RepID=S7P1B5_MYOBR|nr:hypothetical protein D623_10029996 [Myotis brandtii]